MDCLLAVQCICSMSGCLIPHPAVLYLYEMFGILGTNQRASRGKLLGPHSESLNRLLDDFIQTSFQQTFWCRVKFLVDTVQQKVSVKNVLYIFFVSVASCRKLYSEVGEQDHVLHSQCLWTGYLNHTGSGTCRSG